MLRLLTFGGLSLVNDGAPVTGAASQRSRLALLAILAAAGPAGVSRDKLLVSLWPESDDERARHALKQAVYALRRDLGNENAIAGTAALTLDPLIVTSDIREFEDAIARGDDATADALHTGPFLYGVFVRGAAEFDQWAGSERGRLERAYLDAIGRLARAAEQRGDLAESAQWWRKAAAAEPVSGRVALLLMRALAESGDVSAAILHARLHDSVVRAELDTAGDEAVLAFAEELKSGNWKPAPRAAAVAPPPRPASPSDTPTASEPTPGEPARADIPALTSPARSPRLRISIGAVALAAGIAAIVALILLRRHPPVSNQVVVAAFDNRTSDKTLDPLGLFAADVVVRALDHANFIVVDTRTAQLATRWVASIAPTTGVEEAIARRHSRVKRDRARWLPAGSTRRAIRCSSRRASSTPHAV